MKNIIQLLILSACCFPAFVFGQIKGDLEKTPFIEVTGFSEIEVVPDEIYLSIVLREKYISKEKVTIDQMEEKLRHALMEIGIDFKNLSLADANADYVKIRYKKKDVLTKKDFTLKVKNAFQISQVFQQLDKIDITDGYISKVSHSKIDSLKREVRIMAVKAAKIKADYLLTAIGEQRGSPLTIREYENGGENYSGPQVQAMMLRSEKNEIQSDGENEMQFRKIKIQTTINARFSIK